MQRPTLLFDEEFHINLPLSGRRLIPGYTGQVGLPLELFLRLYAVTDDDVTLIAGPGDLSPYVERLDGEDEAWRFLRLFTSPDTHYFFQKGIYTIDLGVVAPGAPAGTGMISTETARRVAYQAPGMSRDNQEYVASRDLVSADPGDLSAPAQVLRRREAVSLGGAYRFIDDRIIGEIQRKDIPFPSYE